MDIEDIAGDNKPRNFYEKYNSDDYSKIEKIVHEFLTSSNIQDGKKDGKKLTKYQLSELFISDMRRKYKINPKKEEILYVYRKSFSHVKGERAELLKLLFKKKDVRETSGVMVFAILSSPYPEKDPKDINGKDVNGKDINGKTYQEFSCAYNCYFCPSQPNMPKSYQDKEPAVARSLRNNWNTVLSMRDRFNQYVTNGMEVDKLEVIVKGGTWTSYNSYYRKKLCRDVFYAANTFRDNQPLRDPLSLEEEQKINETAISHIIGITVETRPDTISDEILTEFRECGITRVELGFQHTDNRILKRVNRQHTVKDSQIGIMRLLACGFKVDIHLMPGLPGSDYEKDKKMVEEVLNTNLYRADQLKWYPTIITPYTIIKEWYDKGKYKPWIEDEAKLLELTVYFKQLLHPWNRTNRIQRDFTSDFICGGSTKSNLGDIVKRELHRLGIKCKCIRCREVRNNKLENMELVIRSYDSYTKNPQNDDDQNMELATEYFISYESVDGNVIYGFLRLRLDPNAGLDVFEELQGCAMIRELHVYGKMIPVMSNEKCKQNHGLGTLLVNKAKEIAKDKGYRKMSVISGVGVRNYYRNKHNFKDGKYYLLCELN
jgi:ELP3 family radical SAM enzyme/protein acetyltransferase